MATPLLKEEKNDQLVWTVYEHFICVCIHTHTCLYICIISIYRYTLTLIHIYTLYIYKHTDLYILLCVLLYSFIYVCVGQGKMIFLPFYILLMRPFCDIRQITEEKQKLNYMYTLYLHGIYPGKLSKSPWNGPSHHLKYYLQPKTEERCWGMMRLLMKGY